MHLERYLQIGMAAFAALGTVLLGMGEGSAALPLAAILVSALSVWITDIKGWLRLNRMTADAAGVAAMAASIWQWQGDWSEGQLLALVNFVVYVQFVLLLKQKTTRSYWLLALLSVLQVAVATALNESLEFGLLMVVYMFVGLITMTLFFLHRESGRYRTAAAGAAALLSSPAAAAADRTGTSHDGAKTDRARANRGALDDGRTRWPLAEQAPVFAGVAAAVEMDGGVGWELARRIALVGAASLALTITLFCSVPRLERWSRPSSSGEDSLRLVSAPQEVTLGELGRVIESPEEAMRVRLTADDHPVYLSDEPYFRGAVMATYASNHWSRVPPSQVINVPLRSVSTRGEATVLQAIEMRVRGTPDLPSLYPPIVPAAANDILKDHDVADIIFDRETEQIIRQRESPGKRVAINVRTTGVRGGRQIELISSTHALKAHERAAYMSLPTGPGGGDPLAGTRAIAQRVVAEVDPNDRIAQAKALEAYLRDSPEFRYALQPVPREPGVDPVEDFVTLNHVGHCEFYASALALMLRQAGIPSRLVVGYKGGEWSDQSYYLVRNLHAHAWVEAYIEPRDTLSGTEDDGAARRYGAWLRLDPTSPRDNTLPMLASMGQSIREFFVYWRASWSAYVVQMDAQRQKESVYAPLSQGVVRLAKAAFDGAFWSAVLQELAGLPRRWGLADGGWFSWRGALVAIVAMLLLVALFHGVRLLVRSVTRWRRRRAGDADRRGVAKVEFYRRLEHMLAQHDLVRAGNQTQREFALASGGQLAESPETKAVAALPRYVVEAFYKVRFGNRPLDSGESTAVEQALADLAATLAPARRKPGSP